MPLFEKIMLEEDIKKEIKLDVISLVGKICFKIGKEFLPYVDFNMNVFLAACELALSFSDDDFDFEDYLQNLRHTLSSTFTLIFYGLEECEQTSRYEPYVSKILEFYSTLISNDLYELKPETLKSMLGFIMDMISTIGRNIKQIISPVVLEKLLTKLKNTKVDKIISYANECEADIKLIWRD